MNSVAIIGRLGKAPESRNTTSGKTVANFSIAVDQGYGDQKTTMWLKISAFGKTAENVMKYLEKGSKVAVSGRLEQRSWQDRDGNNRTDFGIAANDVTFLSEKTNKSDSSEFDGPQTEEPPF